MRARGSAIDLATQAWVRATGRRVPLDTCTWLDGPVGDASVVGDSWLEQEVQRHGGEMHDGGGLLNSLDGLASTTFDATHLSDSIVDFYECTSRWRMDVWSQWQPIAWPAAWLLSVVFARRLRQLALPLRPLDTARGMDSRVVRVLDESGRQLGAAWFRTLRATGQTVYSGWYSIVRLPRSDGASIRVVFPLPNGNLIVFLRPSVEPDGSLVLSSPISEFGDDGAYLSVVDVAARTAIVRRIPLSERFRVYVDEEGMLRTDHVVKLWRMPVVRLHYRLAVLPTA